MQLLFKRCSISRFKILIIFIFLSNALCFSQQESQVRFIWTDNAFQTYEKPDIYIISQKSNDTIFPLQWNPLNNDTLYFEATTYRNPVYIELKIESTKKLSNTFNLLPLQTYYITELDTALTVKARPIVYDTLDSNAKLLYSFLLKLFIELIIAIPVASLLRLPGRLLFFVFVANIMSFPLVYVNFVPFYYKEAFAILLEGFFIFLIGWKRLKFTKALLVSLLLNVIAFGIYKGVMLIIKFI